VCGHDRATRDPMAERCGACLQVAKEMSSIATRFSSVAAQSIGNMG